MRRKGSAGKVTKPISAISFTSSPTISLNHFGPREPTLKPQDTLNIIGARLGIDGAWIAKQVEHVVSREGYFSWMDVFASRALAQSLAAGIGG